MYCTNCGQRIDDRAVICVHCGVPVGNAKNYCRNCGSPIPFGNTACQQCGCPVTESVSVAPSEQKSKIAAGLLGIFLGGLGVHNFYLGYNTKGIIQIVVSFFTFGIGSIWGFIEGIMILCGSINKDANGIPLRD